ncbi:hypothetical protein U3G77_13405 [Paenibacillus polymyxa]|nr:hypothetical protein [Paenibacillus polymyxa]MDY8093363.1 hypothetical protein [Paenibacillus polymyxa]WRL59186.1 hypothetical protein U3G77_13405 [Paenibacillus polymyxa]
MEELGLGKIIGYGGGGTLRVGFDLTIAVARHKDEFALGEKLGR